MDIWGVLALIFAGAFFGTLILALFYWREIRPRLLALTPPAPADAPNGEQYEELHHALRVLNDAMVRHSALMAQLPTSFEVSTPAVLEADALAERLLAIEAAQTRTVNALGDLHNAVTREGANALRAVQGVDAAQQPQRAVLARLEDEIAALKAAQAPFEDALVWLQAEFVKLQGTKEIQGELRTAIADQGTSLAELLRHTELITAAQSAQEDALTWLQAEFVKLQGTKEIQGELRTAIADQGSVLETQQIALSTLRTDQGEALDELRKLITALNDAGLSLSATLTQHSDMMARLEDSQAALQARTDQLIGESQAALADLHRLLAALNSANLSVTAELTGHGDAIRRLEEQQARDEERQEQEEALVASLREHIEQLLAGQQAQTELLDALARREPSVQTVIHEQQLVTQDRLTDIKGIGPLYAGRLHERGIHNFAQLAALDEEELEFMLQVSGRRGGLNAAAILEQAALLAGHAAKADASQAAGQKAEGEA